MFCKEVFEIVRQSRCSRRRPSDDQCRSRRPLRRLDQRQKLLLAFDSFLASRRRHSRRL